MTDADLFNRLAVALAIGLLIGLQRGWQFRAAEEHHRAAGLRTFALTGLLGGLAGAVGQHLGGIVTGLAFAAYALAFAAFRWIEARATSDVSVTSVVAGMVTFLLGVLAVVGEMQLAVGGAVATAVLLALRDPLHLWLARLTSVELRAVLILLVMTFLLLPLLPDRPVDPLGVVNLREVWILTILVAAMSFVGYVAVRLLGDRLGVLVTAAAGGLASSTATTLVLARLAPAQPDAAGLLAAGVLASGAMMVLRVLAIVATLTPPVLALIWPPMVAGAATLAAGALVFSRGHARRAAPPLAIDNPLVLGTALRLAGLIVAVTLLADLARRTFGNAGLLAVAGLSGLADVDAVTLSMARLPGDLTAMAGQAILLAVAVNTLVKAAIGLVVGGRAIGLRVSGVSLLALALGAAALRLP